MGEAGETRRAPPPHGYSTMKKYILAAIVLCSFSLPSAPAAELKVWPSDVALSGPHAYQRLSVLAQEDGKFTGDLTKKAKFRSSNPKVATVDEAGNVRAVGDGAAAITVSHDGKEVTAKVKVTGTKEPFAWSFRNHVIPLMSKIGCNSGACHGALAGKGGLKLSLRGYAPVLDHFVLTRQAQGRRIDRLEPSHSLLLQKPTMAVPHGGGQKLEVGSADFQILADWIAAGAPEPRQDDPRIERLEIFPAEAVLKPKDALQVLVRAWYSDGLARDVTHWCKFN